MQLENILTYYGKHIPYNSPRLVFLKFKLSDGGFYQDREKTVLYCDRKPNFEALSMRIMNRYNHFELIGIKHI